MPLPSHDPHHSLARHARVILVLDVVESVRIMEADEAGFIGRWRRFVRQVREDVLQAHGGAIRKSLGDGLMLEFDEPAAAVRAARAILALSNAGGERTGAEPSIRLRMALHLTEYVSDELDIYGSGVNLTARLAQSAQPGEVLVTAVLHDTLPESARAGLLDAGSLVLRHVSRPVHAYQLTASPFVPAPDAAGDSQFALDGDASEPA